MRGEEGFTIVESLVAMAILSVVLVTLYGVGADLLRDSTHVASVDRATLFAQSRLDALATVVGPLPGRDEGEDAGFHWTVTAQNISGNAPSSPQTLQDVHLVVRWQEGANERSLAVDTRHLGRKGP